MSHRNENPELVSMDVDSPADTSAAAANSGGPATTCCGLGRLLMPILVILTATSICIAAYLVGRNSALESESQSSSVQSWIDQLPVANATASAFSDKYSIATGQVSNESEGFFVLDHNSGLLQCNVIYPRRGQFMARFQVNVAEALGTGGKGGKYIMVTGRADFPRSNARPAASMLVYVMDTGNGNYACYGVPFDHTLVARNQPQQGPLVLVATGSANPIIDRDALR